jgi:hypothetical protein
MRYAHDVIDRYGRLLAYINANVASKVRRPLTYNERQLEAGLALPYFIWPNVDPFKKQATLLGAVFTPAELKHVADTGALGQARTWVRRSRAAAKGVFSSEDPLLLEPFELRYLAGRRRPDRSVIDLAGRHKKLLEPGAYYEVKDAEDRLYIPAEFVPLFKAKGW